MQARVINSAGLALIKQFEGLRLIAYKDIARKVWTIGYGHTGGVTKEEIISASQAEALLHRDLAAIEDAVNLYTQDVPTTDNDFAAMVSLAFNIGISAFHSSSVLRRHKDRDFIDAADDFLLWDKAHINGQLVEVQGLLNRRWAERSLYLRA